MAVSRLKSDKCRLKEGVEEICAHAVVEDKSLQLKSVQNPHLVVLRVVGALAQRLKPTHCSSKVIRTHSLQF